MGDGCYVWVYVRVRAFVCVCVHNECRVLRECLSLSLNEGVCEREVL